MSFVITIKVVLALDEKVVGRILQLAKGEDWLLSSGGEVEVLDLQHYCGLLDFVKRILKH